MPRSRRHWTLLATTSALACALASTPIDLNFELDQPVLKVAQAASSCFIAGTKVLMADGGERRIETLRPGERVRNGAGGVSRIVTIERPRLGGRKLFGFNGGAGFVTAEHPFLTPSGWKAIDPMATRTSSINSSAVAWGRDATARMIANR